MAPEITDTELQNLLSEGLSQNEIARRTGIPRSTLSRRLKALGTPKVDTSVHQGKDEGIPKVNNGTQAPDELIPTVNDLREIYEWWQERKRALQTEADTEQETQRQTYHMQKRYIEAIKRAADLEHVSIMEIVNRAFSHYFNREHE